MADDDRKEELRAIRKSLTEMRAQLSETEARLARLEVAEPAGEPEDRGDVFIPDAVSEAKPSVSPMPPPPPPKPVLPSMSTPEEGKPAPPLPEPEKVEPKKPAATREDWEKWIGTYLAPRLGALFVVTAGVLLLSMAANQLGEAGRVGIGYGAAGVLLGVGFWQERKYLQFGRILIGAGFALAYFVSYAAHYIEFARVFESRGISWVLMTAVVIAWAAIALWRNSTIMASVVVVLGHATVFITGPAAESVVAIVILSIGCAAMLARKRWTVVGGLGVALSYANYFAWLANSEGSGTLGEFYMAMSFLAANFAAFALGDFLGPRADTDDRLDIRLRSIILSANTGLFLALGAFLIQNSPFEDPPFDKFFLLSSVPLLALSIGHLRRRNADPVFNLYMTKGVAIATLGIALAVDRDARTAAWAIEAAVLWMSARRSGLLVTRALAMALGALTICMAFADWNGHAQVVNGPIVSASIAWIAWWVAAWIAERTDWKSRSPESIPNLEPLQGFLFEIGFVTRPAADQSESDVRRFYHFAFGLLGAALTMMLILRAIPTGSVFMFVAGSVLVLAMAAGAASMRSADIAAIILSFAAVATLIHRFVVIGSYELFGIVATLAVATTCFFGETRYVGDREGWTYRSNKFVLPLLYVAPAIMFTMVLVELVDSQAVPMTMTVAAFLTAFATAVLNRPGMKTVSLFFLFVALGGHAAAYNALDGALRFLSQVALVAYPVVTHQFYRSREEPVGRVATNLAYVPASICAMMMLVPDLMNEPIYPVGWAILAVALFACGAWHRIRTALVFGLLTLALATFVAFVHSAESSRDVIPHILSFLAVIAVWIGLNRFAMRAEGGTFVKKLVHLPMVIAAIMSVFLVAMYPGISAEMIAIGWTLIALAWFAISIPLHDSVYRYAGMAIFVLAIGRVVIIVLASDMATIYKVAAAFVLGVVLLGIGWAYYRWQAALEPEKLIADEVSEDVESGEEE